MCVRGGGGGEGRCPKPWPKNGILQIPMNFRPFDKTKTQVGAVKCTMSVSIRGLPTEQGLAGSAGERGVSFLLTPEIPTAFCEAVADPPPSIATSTQCYQSPSLPPPPPRRRPSSRSFPFLVQCLCPCHVGFSNRCFSKSLMTKRSSSRIPDIRVSIESTDRLFSMASNRMLPPVSPKLLPDTSNCVNVDVLRNASASARADPMPRSLLETFRVRRTVFSRTPSNRAQPPSSPKRFKRRFRSLTLLLMVRLLPRARAPAARMLLSRRLRLWMV